MPTVALERRRGPATSSAGAEEAPTRLCPFSFVVVNCRYLMYLTFHTCLCTGHRGPLRGPGLRHGHKPYANNDLKKKKKKERYGRSGKRP